MFGMQSAFDGGRTMDGRPGAGPDNRLARFSGRVPSRMVLRLRRWLWGDNDLADAEVHAWWCAERDKSLLEYFNKQKGDGKNVDVKAALELAESVAKAETERETNLNTRGAAVAAVAGIIVPIATALAKPLFTTVDQHWVGFPRNLAEYLFIGALVCAVSAMVMAVVGVLRPGRGGQTKNAVGEAVVSVWRRENGYIALAEATDEKIAIFRLDHLLRTIPTWHYRNRSKARWLRRAWIFLMLGVILIGVVGVIFLTELSSETIWVETASVIAISVIVIWLLIRFDLVHAGRPHKQAKDADKQRWAEDEAEKIQVIWLKTVAAKEAEKNVERLGSSAPAATDPAKADPGGAAASAFGAIGTMTTAYFGIRATSNAAQSFVPSTPTAPPGTADGPSGPGDGPPRPPTAERAAPSAEVPEADT